jgi:TIR domain
MCGDTHATNAGFDAFISYSGADDRVIVSQLHNRIEKIAKKWYRPPMVRVFFDKASIAAGTKLWDRIEYGLSRASWLVLIASPQSAGSKWVRKEVEWWMANRSLDTVFIVHTDGALSWDAARRLLCRFDRHRAVST